MLSICCKQIGINSESLTNITLSGISNIDEANVKLFKRIVKKMKKYFRKYYLSGIMSDFHVSGSTKEAIITIFLFITISQSSYYENRASLYKN